MKKQITSAFAIIMALLALSASVSAYAQAARRVSVEIPFEFVAGGERLPAGRYSIKSVLRNSDKMLLIQSEDGRRAATVLTNTGRQQESGRAELTFRQYGEQFFLSRVWVSGLAAARELPQSKLEKRLRRELRERAQSEGRAGEPADGKEVTVAGQLK